jgi:hypothetical protein
MTGTGTTRWVSRPTPEAQPNIVTVTIGRNVGLEPMVSPKWDAFCREVGEALRVTVGRPDFTVRGPGGAWQGDPEDSCVFTVIDPDVSAVINLRRRLRFLALDYGQECIALTVGHSELVDAAA